MPELDISTVRAIDGAAAMKNGMRRAGGKAGTKSCEAAVKGCGTSKCPEELGAAGVRSTWEQCLS